MAADDGVDSGRSAIAQQASAWDCVTRVALASEVPRCIAQALCLVQHARRASEVASQPAHRRTLPPVRTRVTIADTTRQRRGRTPLRVRRKGIRVNSPPGPPAGQGSPWAKSATSREDHRTDDGTSQQQKLKSGLEWDWVSNRARRLGAFIRRPGMGRFINASWPIGAASLRIGCHEAPQRRMAVGTRPRLRWMWCRSFARGRGRGRRFRPGPSPGDIDRGDAQSPLTAGFWPGGGNCSAVNPDFFVIAVAMAAGLVFAGS